MVNAAPSSVALPSEQQVVDASCEAPLQLFATLRLAGRIALSGLSREGAKPAEEES
jgi:hypothetical protein